MDDAMKADDRGEEKVCSIGLDLGLGFPVGDCRSVRSGLMGIRSGVGNGPR